MCLSQTHSSMQMRIKEAHCIKCYEWYCWYCIVLLLWWPVGRDNLGPLQLATHNFEVIGSFTEHGLIKVTNH